MPPEFSFVTAAALHWLAAFPRQGTSPSDELLWEVIQAANALGDDEMLRTIGRHRPPVVQHRPDWILGEEERRDWALLIMADNDHLESCHRRSDPFDDDWTRVDVAEP